MKNKLLYFFFCLAISSFIFSCGNDDDTIDYGAEQNVQRNDPVMFVYTPVISFVAGEPEYAVEFFTFIPESNGTSKVELFGSYTDTDGNTSNEKVFKTFDVSKGETSVAGTITYAELKNGLTVNGAALPDNEVELPVGAIWNLSLRPTDGSGAATFGTKDVKVAVLSPFAGLYKVIESNYFRIGVEQGGWNDSERFIGSIDATSFSHNDYWGGFAAPGFFRFILNADNTITIPDEEEQLFFSGTYMLTCQEDPDKLTNVPCTDSNVLIPADDGKHILKLTYGYFTEATDPVNTGPREFYEILEKITD